MMSFDSVSEESNGADATANGRTHSKDNDAMCISPGSSGAGRTSRSKNYERGPKHKSKKRKRDRSSSVKRSGRSRSRDRSRRDRDSRNGMDSSRRRGNERKSSRKFSRRSRSRSRTPVYSSSRSNKRKAGKSSSSRRRRRSTSSSSSDEDLSITERQQGVTLSSLLTSGKNKTKSKKSKKSRRRRGSSTSSSSSADTTKNQEVLPSAAQATFMDQNAALNYFYQSMIVPMAQPPPSNISMSMTVPPFAAPPPVPPAPPSLAHIHMPPPPLPSLPSLPPGAPPMPPLQSGSTVVAHQTTVVATAIVGRNNMEQQVTSTVTSSTSARMSLPLPNVGRRRNYDQPVVLNKKRRVIDLLNERGSGFVENYEMANIVGEGTYGKVYKANDKITGYQVALKKLRQENEKEGFPITAVREINILRQLNHPNVVKLIEIVTDKQTASDLRNDKVNFYLVFEYVDHDLTGVLEAARKHVIPSFTSEQVAGMFKQLLQGLEYCHIANVLHRDIKCSNILVNNRCVLKICDFGLARLYQEDEDQKRLYTNGVITLWYRPPELLLGEKHYGPHVDVWSVGCILAEFFIKNALFMANTEMEQLDIVSMLCGSPTPETWPDVEKLPLYHTFRPKRIYFRKLKEEFDTLMPAGALDLMDKLLTMDPKRRPTASEALKHYWVKNVDPSKVLLPTLPQNMAYNEMWSERQQKRKSDYLVNLAVPCEKYRIASRVSEVELGAGAVDGYGTPGRPRSPDINIPAIPQTPAAAGYWNQTGAYAGPFAAPAMDRHSMYASAQAQQQGMGMMVRPAWPQVAQPPPPAPTEPLGVPPPPAMWNGRFTAFFGHGTSANDTRSDMDVDDSPLNGSTTSSNNMASRGGGRGERGGGRGAGGWNNNNGQGW